MNGTIKIWEDEFASMTPEQKAYIRTLGNAWREAADLREVVRLQEVKITEQSSLLEQRQVMNDRLFVALKTNAFRLGTQDRELIQLRASNNGLEAALRRAEATVAELQAGDVGRLRQSVDYQAMEIQRLKAALWHGGKLDQVLIDILGTRPLGHESGDGMLCWCDPEMDQAIAAKLDAYKGKVAALTEDLAAAKRTLKGAAADWDRSQAKITKLEAERDEAKAAAKRGTDEAKRLAAIAEHSNNLAQNRLEEAARLRREVAELKESLKAEQALVTEQRQAIAMQCEALAAERAKVAELKESLKGRDEMIAAQNYDYQLWRHVADHATRVRFQRLREQGFKP